MRAARDRDARGIQTRLGRDPVQQSTQVADGVGPETSVVEPLVGVP